MVLKLSAFRHCTARVNRRIARRTVGKKKQTNEGDIRGAVEGWAELQTPDPTFQRIATCMMGKGVLRTYPPYDYHTIRYRNKADMC